MNATTLQWVALVACAGGVALRVPGAVRGRGRLIFSALVLVTVAVALSLEPVYELVDGVLGGANAANLVLRLTLYAAFLLLGVRVAAALGSSPARRLISGSAGLVILGGAVAATVYFFLASDLPFSSTGLRAFDEQRTVRHYASLGRIYPGYVAACLVVPSVASVLDPHARVVHRIASACLAAGFFLVVLFVVLRLLPLELGTWDIVLPFSAILLTVLGLCLIWLQHAFNRRDGTRSNPLA
ncbi:hypothetical protein AC792_13850 [Arthrobacter sp. RIT-PI-e]|uniref:hypothetical protein n=1 Tax=Arthrobacter sp. RIT-PI-e TaxID=1681197 RepID=UPI00067669A7|nr:hypothetical protein [Arthrobacter sp. RIT-PI-e]KNC17715.1 hypothetical protein AC792_13850 [Arthrobacter sp. RIT-PI-e]